MLDENLQRHSLVLVHGVFDRCHPEAAAEELALRRMKGSLPVVVTSRSFAPLRMTSPQTLKTELIYRTDLGVPLPVARTTHVEQDNATWTWKVTALTLHEAETPLGPDL